ncbi:tRNA (adenosine(37)-N6)-threonylcarbamoyltransferase complex dimerization subunit type 1 TsaB [Mesorhizobium sp. BAC0120]|uniref:tRNA (adenosine(37)-N6)-threonylcarbamoyltransferase complex dimerization subunit type 1 TsaB n=1 Tax=Mesorhizobium sp. BAC0120 TaxID=3090670 RepID=UPI00298C49A5|nr:tRNA (adenosine(37)-N6)-threonylcarbamoyltransferase complex dimerization subunit type 1 TsaB [Mesorhizobium sp. BAC0120]MDW6025179.1 tRNA (adenosine(37)-N6)-threonylcarbamoyltransferase complex dimerization subunit type 1 TsaB [Mesorhizobium sp. BAC0120]
MNLLAIDTAANLCAACVYDADAARELGRSVRDIGKGHAEVLMDVIGEALAAAGLQLRDMGALAVAVGPGSFTGIRVGVSVARGLALALKAPAAGITTLEALAFEARQKFAGDSVLAAIDGGRDGIYVAAYDGLGKVSYAPVVVDLETAMGLARAAAVVTGSAAKRIAEAAGLESLQIGSEAPTADIATYARLAVANGFSGEKPRPLYLRAPDAKPQTHLSLPRKES